MLAYDSSSLSVDQLLLEAAALRTKLALSDQQRVVEDVIQEQMKEMLQDSSGVMANFSEDSSMASTAADAVEHMCRAKHEAESKLEALQTDVVAPLNKKVEELQAENERLQRALNEAKLLASAAPAQPLVVEVQQLRQANELLRQQLTKAQDISRTTAETLTATTNEVMALNAISPDYIQAMEKLKGDVHDARAANDLLRVQMEELTRRHAVEDLLSHANHDSLRKAMNATVQNLHHELAEREREVLALQASLARNTEQCESQVAKLKRRSNDDNDDDDCASEEPSNQRRRLMRGDAAEDSSMRSQCIHYWLTGKRKVAELEKRVAELEGVEMTSCTSQRRVTQLEQRKTHMNRQLVAMSSEIERLREDGRRLRAQCAGLEAERDRLLTTTAMTLRPDMSEQDLRDCCQVIREAAAREAASSAAVVADPEALKRAMSRALELKTEVAQLQKQKDALLRYVRMREERVGSILDEGAVSASNRAGTVTASSPVSSAMTTLTLPEVLEYTKNCAKDVFAAIERASLSGTSSGVLSTLGLEPSLTLRGCTEGSSEITPHMHSFVACLNQVREADAQRINAEERATVLERELLLLKGEYAESLANLNKKEMVSQQNEAALHRTNASLTRQTLFLTSQMQQLTTKFDASVQLSKHALGAFSCLLNSMRCEMSHVEGLRQMVEQERNDMVAVLQRIDPMLSEENKRTVTTVADALDRLSAYMSQTISSEGTRSEMQRTAYVAKLVMAMKEQEETTQRLKVTFSEASLQQATDIAERIARAQEQWESTWKSKFASLEEETRQKSMRQLSQTAVFQAVERVAATPPQSSSSPTASDAGSLPQSISDTLAAISSFIQSASVIAASPGNSATPSTQPHELLPSLPSMTQGGGASLGVDGDEPSPSA